MFGYPFGDFSPEHAKWLVAKKAELTKQYPGPAYFDLILDKLNTREFGREPRHDARLPRPQAFSLGLLRRLLHVAVQQ
jgi:hypothetical protein